MRIFTKTQLALIFLAIASFIGVVTSLIANSLTTRYVIQEAQERVKEDLNTARWVYSTRLMDIDQTIHWMSIRHVLKRGVRERNLSPLQEEFIRIMTEGGLDFLTVLDRKGTVLHRFHNPHVSGDSQFQDPFFREAKEKKGISGTQILSHEDLLKEGEDLAKRAVFRLISTPRARPTDETEETSGMVLRSAHPILDFNGDLLGVLTGGSLLNRNYEIVDRIKNIVFKDAKYLGKEIGTATIFMDDLRISTNVLNQEGSRAVGTRVSAEVYDQVFEKGKRWIQRAFVVNDWYITAYEPIRDIEGKIAGILYVGMLESKYAAMKERIILLFLLISMSGMFLALAVSFLLSWKMFHR